MDPLEYQKCFCGHNLFDGPPGNVTADRDNATNVVKYRGACTAFVLYKNKQGRQPIYNDVLLTKPPKAPTPIKTYL